MKKMDFLQIFPDEICENILGYLAAKDVLEASLVSKSWYERIGRSKASMKKITFVYYGGLDKDLNPVLHSKRAYTKAEVSDNGSKSEKNISRLIVNKFSGSITNLVTSYNPTRKSLPKLKISKKDFLQIFPDVICEKILGYLAPKDILEASMVSKIWYEHIGKSKASMNKITLAYYGDLIKDVNPILNSKRAYTKVKFSVDRFIFDGNRQIENIYRLILNMFSDSITNLVTSHDTTLISLPELKDVFFRSDCIDFYKNGLLSTTKLIESFGITSECYGDSLEISKTFLRNMTNLRVFKSSRNNILRNFSDWYNRSIKLEEFHCFSGIAEYFSYVHQFPLAYRSTLKVIYIEAPVTDVLESIFTDFPQLHTFKHIKFEGGHVPVNTNITTLIFNNLFMGCHNPYIRLDVLIPSLPNLRVLKVFAVPSEIFVHIDKIHTLKRLVYTTICNRDKVPVTYIEAMLSGLSRRIEVIQSNEI